MKNPRGVIQITLILCAFVILLTIGDYLALHDISNDYVSKKVLESHNVSTLQLPEWTNTSLEWNWVSFSGASRFGFLIINFFTLLVCLRTLRQKS